MSATISVRDVSRWFGDVVALTDVTVDITPGVTALLGANGAGKTTLLRIIAGMVRPSRGSVLVLGRHPRADISVYRDLGVVRETDAMFEGVTARRFVRAVATMHGVGTPDARAVELLRSLDLDPDDRRPLRTYSKGMRQRVNVAQALVHDPQIVALDEPLNGLDPRQRASLTALIRTLGDEGRTVLVSSHVLSEVERLGSRIVVLADGRMLAEGDFHAIRELMDERPHRLRVATDRPHALAAGLLNERVVVGASVGVDSVVVDTVDIAGLRSVVARVARDAGARLNEFVPLDEDLEAVFRYLVRRGVR